MKTLTILGAGWLGFELANVLKNDFKIKVSSRTKDKLKIYEEEGFDSYILNEEKDDFFISIPEDEYRPNFFASIFQSLVLIKLFQNYFYHNNYKPILRTNDLVYGKIGKENRILIIKGVGPDTLRIHLKFPKKNENGAVDMQIKITV